MKKQTKADHKAREKEAISKRQAKLRFRATPKPKFLPDRITVPQFAAGVPAYPSIREIFASTPEEREADRKDMAERFQAHASLTNMVLAFRAGEDPTAALVAAVAALADNPMRDSRVVEETMQKSLEILNKKVVEEGNATPEWSKKFETYRRWKAWTPEEKAEFAAHAAAFYRQTGKTAVVDLIARAQLGIPPLDLGLAPQQT